MLMINDRELALTLTLDTSFVQFLPETLAQHSWLYMAPGHKLHVTNDHPGNESSWVMSCQPSMAQRLWQGKCGVVGGRT